MLKSKHLIGLEDFPISDLNKIIDTSFKFKQILNSPGRKINLLKGKLWSICSLKIPQGQRLVLLWLKRD